MTLDGKTILTTRAGAAASELREVLSGHGATVIEIPTIEIVPPDTWAPVDSAITHLTEYDWIILTSANAVDAFCHRIEGRILPRIAVVGTKTAQRLEQLGHQVAIIPENYSAEGLLAALPGDLKGVRILLPRAHIARGELPDELRRRGVALDVVTVYQTRIPREGAERLRRVVEAGEVDCVTITSGSTARNLLEMIGSDDPVRWLRDLAVASIGPVTTAEAGALGIEVAIEAPAATAEALAEAIATYFRGQAERPASP